MQLLSQKNDQTVLISDFAQIFAVTPKNVFAMETAHFRTIVEEKGVAQPLAEAGPF